MKLEWSETQTHTEWVARSTAGMLKIKRVSGGVHVWRMTSGGWVMVHQLMLRPDDAMVWLEKRYSE